MDRRVRGLCMTLSYIIASMGATVLGSGRTHFSGDEYGDALGKAILFFEGQRSGRLSASQRVKWRADSALSDGAPDQVNLSGGYYDAGDNVKFVWPMSFALSLLSWTAIEYQKEVSSVHQLQNLQDAIRWGTDFIIRAYVSPTTLYTQVGDGNSDHQCWERPEDMDTARTLCKITSSSPGTEPAAEASAALASASIVFNHVDPSYSAKLIAKSISLFKFADTYRGSYQGSCPFYCSYSGFHDELLWAATWLYKATGDDVYLDYISANQGWSQPVWEFSWDNKFVAVQILLAQEYLKGKSGFHNFKNDADSFTCALLPESSSRQIQTTPAGLLRTSDSSNLQYASSASMVLSLYSTILAASHISNVMCGSARISTSQIRKFAKSQVDYMLGDNPMNMSYMVGFGAKYPMELHHRGASIPSIRSHPQKVGCNEGYSIWYSSNNPNPNTHTGALVGGPDANDQFSDVRSDHSHLEPTTYMNAAFVGAVAPLITETNQQCMDRCTHR